MFLERNNRLNEKVGRNTNLLIEFSKQEKLEDKPNLFFKYLNFVSNNEFNLGDKRFKFKFENFPQGEISSMKLYQVVSSVETTTGLKEKEVSINFLIGIGGDVYLFGNTTQTPSHLIGLIFFNGLENLLTSLR